MTQSNSSHLNSAETDLNRCYHCGLQILDHKNNFKLSTENDDQDLRFCCNGCKQAYLLIQDQGFGNYYKVRTDYATRPDNTNSIDESLYSIIEDRLKSKEPVNPVLDSVFLIRGIHCASCVWLNEKILQNVEGVESVEVQLVTGRVRLKWNSEITNLSNMAKSIARVGYRLLPVNQANFDSLNQISTTLLKKMAVAGFFTGNIMLISISLYAGSFSFMDSLTKQFFHYVSWLMATPVYLYSASEFFKSAWAAFRNKVLGMDILTASGISLAYFYSVYITLIADNGEVFFDAICFVVFVILIGRYIEQRIRLKTWYFTQNLVSQIPDFVRLVKESNTTMIAPIDEIKVGDQFVVENGETLAVDGRLLTELAEVDEAALTGEFRPKQKKLGEILIAGSRSLGKQPIYIEATSRHDSSSLYRVKKMADESLHQRPRSQRLAEKVAAIFIGFVLVGGFATFGYWYFYKTDLSAAIIHTVSFLIVACPCALSLSIPTAILVSMQRAFSNGCLIHKAENLELLSKAKNFVFDKTGTLTTGKMHLARIDLFTLNSQNQNLNYLGLARKFQSLAGIEHPITTAFLNEKDTVSSDENNKENKSSITVNYITGQGIEAYKNHATYHLGSIKYLQSLGYQLPQIHNTELLTPVAFGRKTDRFEPLCIFQFSDTLRAESKPTINYINTKLKGHTELLTGDNRSTAELIANQTGITTYQSTLSPEQKRNRIHELRKSDFTIMVGDGVNDTIALSEANIGITFAEASRLALYSADILLLKPDLSLLTFLVQLSKQTKTKMIQNLSISFGYNILLLPLAFLGFITPLLGAIFMSLSSICVVINSLTLMKSKITDLKDQPT